MQYTGEHLSLYIEAPAKDSEDFLRFLKFQIF